MKKEIYETPVFRLLELTPCAPTLAGSTESYSEENSSSWTYFVE